ncbi:MAG TPA: hypothetical protein VJZ31_01940 [Bacilli bacterium]|nr:hypothetical protein [Bacilli bacterium]
MEKPKKPTSLLNNMASVKNLNKGINGKNRQNSQVKGNRGATISRNKNGK